MRDPDGERLRALGVDRYRRNALVPAKVNHLLAVGRSGEAAFDVIEEYSWPDRESARSALADPGWVAAGAGGFAEAPGALAGLVAGRVLPRFGETFPTNEAPPRIFTFLRFRADLDPEAARRYWAGGHGAIAERVIRESFGARSYAQVPADPELEGMLAPARPAGRRHDGFAVTNWAGDPEAVLARLSTEAAGRGNEELLADEPNFMAPPVDQGSTAMMETIATWQIG